MMHSMHLFAFLPLATAAFAAGNLYFPPQQDARWERIEPAKAGWDRAAIDAALDLAGSRRSTAVVILSRQDYG